MFFSIKFQFSLRPYYPDSKTVGRWRPVTDEESLLRQLKFLAEKGIPYKVLTVWNGFVQPVTHLFCERMIWGFDSVGIGLSERALKGDSK